MACFISINIMDVHDGDEKYLPDLDNDKTGEQIVFDQKVFRANEVFVKLHQDIINWYFVTNRQKMLSKNLHEKQKWFQTEVL